MDSTKPPPRSESPSEKRSPANPTYPAGAHRPFREVPALPLDREEVRRSSLVVTNRSIREELEAVTKTEGGGRTQVALEEREDVPLSPPVMMMGRSTREETGSVTKVEGGTEGGGVRGRSVPSILRRSRREPMVGRAALGFRVLGLIFCLISFSVMAADKTRGWAGDSFDRYKEYRYCISITVIGFVYSAFQVFLQTQHLVTGKHVIRHPIRYYLDFSMDQILAYLLMSASSSAATRTDDWVSNWGDDEFTKMATASVGMSFLAFITFSFSALISGYYLCCTRNS